MAKVRFGNLIKGFTGKLGNLFFSSYADGVSVVREAQGSRQPHSNAQAALRSNQALLVRVWKFLDDAQREKWEELSKLTGQNRNKESGKRALIHVPERKLSAFNTFMRHNHLAFSVGRRDVMLAPVLGRAAPLAPRNLKAEFRDKKLFVYWDPNMGKSEIRISKHETNPNNKGSNVSNKAETSMLKEVERESNLFVRIWIRCEQKWFHKQLVGVVPLSCKGMQIATVRAVFGTDIHVDFFQNKAVLIQADVVDKETGLASAPSETIRLMLKHATGAGVPVQTMSGASVAYQWRTSGVRVASPAREDSDSIASIGRDPSLSPEPTTTLPELCAIGADKEDWSGG